MSTAFLGRAEENQAGPVIASVNINSCVGSITISVTSGVAPYTYEWRDSGGTLLPSTSFVADNLTADNYTVTVTDFNGDSVTATYTVTNPPDLVGTVVVNDVTCRGDSDAQVVVTMGNGNPGYDWILNDSGGGQVATGSVAFPNNVITIGGLGVDTYTLDVTDQDGCTGQIIFSVTEPANFLGVNLVNQTNATCSNLANGSLEVAGTGGWGGYTYQWVRVSNGFTVGTTAAISGLLPDDYRVFVTDANGCVVNATYTITSPAPIVTTSSLTNVTCNGLSNGAIDLTVTGGNGGYTYSWSNGATTEDISGLTAGGYSVTITDALGCVYNENFTVTEPAVLTINEDIRDVACFGDNTGRIRSNVSGGTAPYTYAWSTGHSGQNLNNRVAGTYSLTVTDANGCVVGGTFTINEPAMALSVQSSTAALPSCFGGGDGNLSVTMQGGTAPYTYAWSNGSTTSSSGNITSGSYSVTITDANGCVVVENLILNDPPQIAVSSTLTPPTCNGGNDGSITASASNGTGPYTYNWNTGDVGPTVNGLSAGTYQVTVTDAGGCSVVENIVLGEPAVIAGNAVVNNISCNGQVDGSIFLAVTGGSGPYTYLWNTGATTNNISALGAGNYSVTITDSKGCARVENYTVIEPAAIGTSFTKVDVLCKGNASGSIDLTPSGGTAPYTYTWSNGSTTQDVFSLTAGNYSVTVRDASNCSVVVNVTIDEPATVLDLTGVVSDVSCNAGSNGAIDVTVTGGIAPYTYAWNTGATSEDVTNLSAGNYSVQITDGNGCVKSFGFTVNEPSPLVVNPTVSQISCNSADDGSISLAVSGGTAPYTYLWNDGNASQNRSGLSPGNYTVTTTDANGCQNVQNFNIIEPAVLTNNTSKQDVLCFGQSTGVINITPSGGTTPYSFNWSNGATTEDLNAVAAGTYTVTITDANGCSIIENVTITEPSSALSFTDTFSQITCNGAADGAIALNVNGGVAPYTFNWSNGSSSQNLSGLTPGTYSVTITDANGCTLNSAYTITDPPVLSTSGVITDVTCFGASDGMVDLTVNGGEAPYTFIWSHGGNTEDVTGLPPGSFTVQVVDNRGCSVSETFVVSGPTQLTASHTKVDIDCFGNNNGSIDLTVAGGTAPYTYAWSNGANTEDISNLVANIYTVTITDANGCQLVQNIDVNQPAQALSILPTVTDISCFGANNGSVQLVTTGGTAPYTYTWSNGATTKDVFGLIVGNYNVTVVDANGCSVSGVYTINSPAAIQSTSNVQNLSCNGAGDGAIDISVTGGTAPFTYAWSNGATTEDLSGIAAGNYQVLITDANSCTLSRSYTVSEPLALTESATLTHVTCFGVADGSIEVNVGGGVAPYTYLWSNGAVTKDLFNISGGNYSLVITDANGCQVTGNYTLVEPSSALSVTGLVTDVTCFGSGNGVIDISVSGGTAPYTYAWNQGAITEDIAGLNPGGYQVTVTDANGCSVSETFTISGPNQLIINNTTTNLSCNGAGDGAIDLSVGGGSAPYTYTWSNGATTEDLSGLAAGSYQVLVVDTNGCSTSAVIAVQEPATLTLSHSNSDVTCFGGADGAIDLTISGGTFPYTFSWSNGATTEDLSGISGGSYSVTVTDVNGCSITETIVIDSPTATLAGIGNISDETCSGFSNGSIDLTVTGGVAPYTYSWNNGQTTEDLIGLSPGTYEVTIVDSNGCTTIESYDVSGPQPISITGVVTNLSCYEAGDGVIDISASGGTAPYTYSWSNGSILEDITGLQIGNYSVTVTDANGCSASQNFTVTQPLPLTLNNQISHVTCFGETNGAIDLTVIGGTGPYSYSWSNGASTQDLANLGGGTYTVTVTDAQGCTVNTDITVVAPTSPISVSETITNTLCNGDASGAVNLTVSGGTAPYNYQWSNGSSQKDLINVVGGTYDLLVTDANGCTVNYTYQVSSPTPLTASFDAESSTCLGDSDGSIVVQSSGGTGPYTYVWSNGSTSKDQFNLTGGTYNVTITDANNCSITNSVVVGDSRSLSVDVIKTDVLCKGESSAAILLDVTGGSGNYTYLWDTGEATQGLSALSAGVYNVTITDSGGCATTTSVVISEPSLALSADLTKTDHINCFGEASGVASLSVTGGVAPYTYLWSTGERSAQVNDLNAGDYTVSITDANGCSIQESFTITQPAQPIEVSVSGNTDLRCRGANDGSIQLLVTGGTAPYTYLWSVGSTSSRLDNLSAGDYTVRIRDAGGCIVEKIISVVQPDELRIANVNINQSKCFDDRNGAIELDIEGGTLPYTYQWDNGVTTKNLIGIPSGTYSLTVTDSRGCSVQASYTLQDPALFRMNPDLLPVTCVGANDGLISLNIEGGVEPRIIRWNTGASTETVSGLEPGSYNVVVTDGNGCTIQQNFTIVEPLPLTLDAYVEDAVRCGDPKSGRINMIVSGGTEPYRYRWSNGEITSSLYDVLPGTYVVTVTDANDCQVQGTYSVQQPEPLQIGLSTLVVVDCDTREVSSRVVADVVGGTGTYSYNWNIGNSESNEITLSQPARLTLLVTDGLGCSQTRSIDVRIPELADADYRYESEAIDRTGELAANEPVNFFDETIGEAVDWSWEFGDGFTSSEIDPIHTFDAPGVYNVRLLVQDASGCTSERIQTLEITEGYRVMLPNAFTPNADGNNDFFRPKMLGLKKAQFIVYNTWGEVIFSTDDMDSKGWNGLIKGKPAENGNYVYKIIGVSFNGLQVERDGVFALIR